MREKYRRVSTLLGSASPLSESSIAQVLPPDACNFRGRPRWIGISISISSRIRSSIGICVNYWRPVRLQAVPLDHLARGGADGLRPRREHGLERVGK